MYGAMDAVAGTMPNAIVPLVRACPARPAWLQRPACAAPALCRLGLVLNACVTPQLRPHGTLLVYGMLGGDEVPVAVRPLMFKVPPRRVRYTSELSQFLPPDRCWHDECRAARTVRAQGCSHRRLCWRQPARQTQGPALSVS